MADHILHQLVYLLHSGLTTSARLGHPPRHESQPMAKWGGNIQHIPRAD